jgi:hypothetical protein
MKIVSLRKVVTGERAVMINILTHAVPGRVGRFAE